MGGTDSPGVLRTPLATLESLLVHGQSSAGEWSDFGVYDFFAAATFPVSGAEPLRRSLPEAMVGRSRYVLSCENAWPWYDRSEEHTSELQSRFDLVCRLLLEKKKYKKKS